MRRTAFLTLSTLVLAATAMAQMETPTVDRWTDEPYVERYTTMIFIVHPIMARQFQAFYGTKYPELTCESCHGPDPESKRWEMPSAHLDALSPSDLPEPGSAPEVDFMYDTVTPMLSRLMDKPMQSPEHPDGVSCFSCHVEKTS